MFSWFKSRDADAFPADAYGDDLYRVMQKNSAGESSIGVDLTFAFADEADARAFADLIDQPDNHPALEEPDAAGDPWIVEAMRETQARYAPVRVLIESMRSDVEARKGQLTKWHLFW